MRTFHVAGVLLILTFLASAKVAFGTITLGASCTGNTVRIGLGVCNTYDAEMTGIVIARQEIGTCASPEIISAAPVPMPPPGNPYLAEDWVQFGLEFPVPFPGINYRYTALVTDGDGTPHAIANGSFPTWDCQPQLTDVASCEDAVILRAEIVFMGTDGIWTYLGIRPCEEGCWGTNAFVTVPISDPLVAAAGAGVVDVRGSIRHSNCFGISGGPYDVTGIEPAPGGACGPVPVRSMTFGALKATFR